MSNETWEGRDVHPNVQDSFEPSYEHGAYGCLDLHDSETSVIKRNENAVWIKVECSECTGGIIRYNNDKS